MDQETGKISSSAVKNMFIFNKGAANSEVGVSPQKGRGTRARVGAVQYRYIISLTELKPH